MMNSDEALASPFNACTNRKDRSMIAPCRRCRRPRPDPKPLQRPAAAAANPTYPGEIRPNSSLFLARGLYVGLGKHVVGTVLVAPVLHASELTVAAGLADPGAHRRLLIEGAHRNRAEDGIEGLAAQAGQQLFGFGRAGLVEHVLDHVRDHVA